MNFRSAIRTTAALLAGGAAAAMLTACGAAGGFFDEPDANLDDARLIGLTTSTMDLELDFLVDNPNSYDLPIKNVAWTLELWGEPFADGITELEEAVPAAMESNITVPVTLNLDDVIGGVEMAFDGKPIPYTIDGDVTVETSVGSLALPYDKPGEWDNPLADFNLP